MRNNIWRYKVGEEENKTHHPAVFPIKLAIDHILSWSNENDIVLDCFSGSGTTAVACHNLNRRFICIEKDKDYYEVSVKRLKDAQSQILLTNVNNIERPKEVKMINDIDEMELF